MDLAFSTRELRQICESTECALNTFGPGLSGLLKERLADFVAARCPADLLVGNPRVVATSDGEHMAVSLEDGYEVRFSANHSTNPTTESGNIDWPRVSRIKIIGVSRDNP